MRNDSVINTKCIWRWEGSIYNFRRQFTQSSDDRSFLYFYFWCHFAEYWNLLPELTNIKAGTMYKFQFKRALLSGYWQGLSNPQTHWYEWLLANYNCWYNNIWWVFMVPRIIEINDDFSKGCIWNQLFWTIFIVWKMEHFMT